MEIKFFPRDIVSGKAAKAGDRFTAKFMTGTCRFEVTSFHGDFFFAVMV